MAGEGDPPPLPAKNWTQKGSYEYDPGIIYNGFKVIVFKEKISPCLVGEILEKKYSSEHVTRVVKNGRDCVIVHCRSAQIANEISKYQDLIELEYKPYIPLYYVASCGLVFDIDTKYTCDNLLVKLKAGQYKIHSVQRVTRAIRENDNVTQMDTRRVKVFFKGTQVPQYVIMNLVQLKCEPFVGRVMTCTKCWKMGHTTSRCTIKTPRCKVCLLDSHLSDSCTSTQHICASCSGQHVSTYQFCNERLRQQNIQTAMATKNLSKNEASQLFPVKRHNPLDFNQLFVKNRFDVLDEEDDVEWPQLVPAHMRKKKSTNTNEQIIPSHDKPDLPVVDERSRSVSKNRGRGGGRGRSTSTRRSGPLQNNRGGKRGERSDDDILDEEMQRVAKERKLQEDQQQATIDKTNPDALKPSHSRTHFNRTNFNNTTQNNNNTPQRSSADIIQEAHKQLEYVKTLATLLPSGAPPQTGDHDEIMITEND
ncbi:hypothetical protein DMENIID0001_006210 [Sergentomyia squamirostris]